MLNKVELCNSSGRIIHVLPREEDLNLNIDFDSLISHFVEEIRERKWYNQKEERGEVVTLFFDEGYLLDTSCLFWGYLIKKRI